MFKNNVEFSGKKIYLNDLSLDLSGILINKDNIDELIGILKKFPLLKNIKLSNCSLNDELFSNIIDNLYINQSLIELDVSYNNIKDNSLEKLKNYIKSSNTLKILNMEYNIINNNGLSFLADGIYENKSLYNIFLYKNNFSIKGLKYLFEKIISKKNLKKISLKIDTFGLSILFLMKKLITHSNIKIITNYKNIDYDKMNLLSKIEYLDDLIEEIKSLINNKDISIYEIGAKLKDVIIIINDLKKVFIDKNYDFLQNKDYNLGLKGDLINLGTLVEKRSKYKFLLLNFYKNTINILQSIEILLKEKTLISLYNKVKVFEKDLELEYNIYKKNYLSIMKLLLYKYSSLYGSSFKYLIIFTIIITTIFGFLFLISDIYLGSNISNIHNISNFIYYFYISLSTLSNLGVDTSLASTNFLIVLFSLEQVIGVLIFGILINSINNMLS